MNGAFVSLDPKWAESMSPLTDAVFPEQRPGTHFVTDTVPEGDRLVRRVLSLPIFQEGAALAG
jgi:hypothetical protein